MTVMNATAFAPATVGNVIVGFDLLGLCIDANVGDLVTVTRIDEPVVRVDEIISDEPISLPDDPTKNTATAGLVHLIAEKQLPFGFAVTIKKGIPLGSGMGGSAASAAGGIVAANALLDTPLTDRELFHYSLLGEAVASGAAHGDNLAPCLFGGLQLITSNAPLRWTTLPTPSGLSSVLVHPHMRLDTKQARGVLQRPFELHDFVEQSAYLAGFIAACFGDDVNALAHSLNDILIEPHRKSLIPGFDDVQRAALDHGALGCSISGAGPSMFALCRTEEAQTIQDAMVKAFAEHGHMPSDAYTSPLNARGAFVTNTDEQNSAE